jgi:hypothetical protein
MRLTPERLMAAGAVVVLAGHIFRALGVAVFGFDTVGGSLALLVVNMLILVGMGGDAGAALYPKHGGYGAAATTERAQLPIAPVRQPTDGWSRLSTSHRTVGNGFATTP